MDRNRKLPMAPFSQREPPPLPPPELRQLIGALTEEVYDNPSGALVFPELPLPAYDFVFDWGCGCGRVARKLLQQHPQPGKYIGIDLHRGMIQWCRRHLSTYADQFEFHHHDVRNLGLNPGAAAEVLPFPVADAMVTLFLAVSVFTHVNETAAAFYLKELSRVLHPSGTAITTWFLFDKTEFPMMQEFQNALFINDIDPTNAVLFDRSWLRGAADRAGIVLTRIVPPIVRGFQWSIYMSKAAPGAVHADFPLDEAPPGVLRPPLMPANADHLGLDGQEGEQ